MKEPTPQEMAPFSAMQADAGTAQQITPPVGTQNFYAQEQEAWARQHAANMGMPGYQNFVQPGNMGPGFIPPYAQADMSAGTYYGNFTQMPQFTPVTGQSHPQPASAPSSEQVSEHEQCGCEHGETASQQEPTDAWQNLGQMFGAGGGFPGGNLFGAAFAGIPGFAQAFSEQGKSTDHKHQENHYGQMFELYSDLMQGKTDPSKIASFLSSSSGNFWKGAIVGALLTFVMTNSSVKSALAKTFSSIFNSAKND